MLFGMHRVNGKFFVTGRSHLLVQVMHLKTELPLPVLFLISIEKLLLSV